MKILRGKPMLVLLPFALAACRDSDSPTAPTPRRAASIVAAGTYVVNTTDDGDDGTCDATHCSLREAITAANAAGSATTITFDIPGCAVSPCSITLGSFLPQITSVPGITIDGAGQKVAVSGNTAYPVLRVLGTAMINNLTLERGFTAFSGGGIDNLGTLTVVNSTISDNSAPRIFDGFGGGIYNEAGATLTVVNSTFSGNSAFLGGAIYNEGTLTVTNGTFSGNATSGIVNDFANGGTIRLRNTIMAGGGDVCQAPFGGIMDDGHNMDTGTSCGFTDPTSQSSTDPLLGLLADNGGPTLTHALLPGSPAIDGGICTDYTGTTILADQRGVSRPQGSTCDIGAFEVQTLWSFTGFFAPVDNSPVVNVVKAGSAIPVKFGLGGDRGLNIFANGYPTAPAAPCAAGAPTDGLTEVVSAGNSGLSYDATTGLYTYVWKTDKPWANTCRTLTLKFIDGTTKTASFQFTK